MKEENENVSARIRANFIELLINKPYKKITFKEIAAVSNMSRQNLYYYYSSKEQVLEHVMEVFFESIYEKMTSTGARLQGSANEEQLGREMVALVFAELEKNEQVAKCFFSRDVNVIFVTKQIAFLKRLFGRYVRTQNIKVNDPKYIHYLALEVAGSSYLVFREWFMVDRDFPPERIMDLGQPVIQQVLTSLAKN